MDIRRPLFWTLAALLAALLTGCAPHCSEADLVQPIPSGPIPDSIINDLSSPILWNYPAGYECQPDGFRLEIATDMNFHDLYTTATTGAFVTSWTPATPFDALEEYWWRVAGGVDDGAGGLTLGPWSAPVRFFTGPVCDPAHQSSPVLDWPGAGETIDTVLPLLQWHYVGPGCTPEGYRIDLSTEPDFVDTSLSGGTGNPRTRWFPGDDLLDCGDYYWRVAPIVGTALGPFSETRTFHVDVAGLCGPSIGGQVWHDECGLPELGPFPASPPPGCIETDGYYGANGVLDVGELGIEGVVVRLGAGPCPSTGLAAVETGADGSYRFSGLADGAYCVSVDALADGNDLDLIPGGWSNPTTSGSQASHEAVMAGGANVSEVNFGWDYQFLPSFTGFSIVGTVWHDMCAVPWGPAPETPPEGCVETGDGGLVADGIFDAGEPGIEGVTVDLGIGSCPSTGYWTAVTNADGVYEIPGLVGGTYCLSIDPSAHGNDAILIPGQWTHPELGVPIAEYELSFELPEEGVDVGMPILNFGWDYQFLPSPGGTKSAKAKEDSNCRAGPDLMYPVDWFLLKGAMAEVEARDPTGLWFQIRRSDGGGLCWVAKVRLEWFFDEEELTVRIGYPLPTQTPTQGPKR
jgi:hypothetical protein